MPGSRGRRRNDLAGHLAQGRALPAAVRIEVGFAAGDQPPLARNPWCWCAPRDNSPKPRKLSTGDCLPDPELTLRHAMHWASLSLHLEVPMKLSAPLAFALFCRCQAPSPRPSLSPSPTCRARRSPPSPQRPRAKSSRPPPTCSPAPSRPANRLPDPRSGGRPMRLRRHLHLRLRHRE